MELVCDRRRHWMYLDELYRVCSSIRDVDISSSFVAIEMNDSF